MLAGILGLTVFTASSVSNNVAQKIPITFEKSNKDRHGTRQHLARRH